jgi:hypothetical protein
MLILTAYNLWLSNAIKNNSLKVKSATEATRKNARILTAIHFYSFNYHNREKQRRVSPKADKTILIYRP